MRFVFGCVAIAFLAWSPAPASAGDAGQQLLYLATWPHEIVIFDAAQEKIVDRINLDTDVAQYLILSPDKKKLYASTVNDNSIVTIDLATRKVVSSFTLNSGNRNVRLLGLASDTTGKYLYGIATTVVKQIDHYDVEPTKLIVIDLESRKIIRSADFPKEESLFWRIQMKFSPDGKRLYLFLSDILVFDTSNLQLVKKIDLADPHVPGIGNVIFNSVEEDATEDPNEAPGKLTNLFLSTDPYVHRAVFGIATIDLAALSFDFTPVAPATTLSMTPLLMTPDRQFGYTIAIDGSPGNRRCEFWAFDMKTRRIINKKEFAGRNRFSFAISADGTKLFVYGAGYEVDVYDAKTFALRNNIPLPGDLSSNIIVMPMSVTVSSADTSATISASVR